MFGATDIHYLWLQTRKISLQGASKMLQLLEYAITKKL